MKLIHKFIKIFAILLSILWISEANAQKKIVKKIEKSVGVQWSQSYEEQKNDEIMIFRPSTFDFPPSRGRVGVEFFKNGTSIWLQIAPSCGLEPVNAFWKGDILAVGTKTTTLYRIIKIDPQILKIKPLK